LLACNHPNSFLDALIIGSRFKEEVYFLARGDAFKNPLAKKILSLFKMIPIYRLSEGREYLALNDATFEKCQQVLLNKGIVLIFSEGLCENTWALRRLKKGSARIALGAWAQAPIAAAFSIVPVSINYDSFHLFNKRIIIHFDEVITEGDLAKNLSEGERINQLNQLIFKRLKEGMIETNGNEKVVQSLISNHASIAKGDVIHELKEKQILIAQNKLAHSFEKLKEPGLLLITNQKFILSCFPLIILVIPAFGAWILHAPLIIPLKAFVKSKTKNTVFYDSVLFGILLIAYPLYWLLINVLCLLLIDNIVVRILLLLLPLLAFLYLKFKDFYIGVSNYLLLRKEERKTLLEILFTSV
jgi:1-acyl-sn-glycerol-3-phosphate acyltransferase